MFLVPTFLAPSEIHGMGVFAARDIPADTRIWTFTDGVDWRLSPDDMARIPQAFQAALRAWCYLDADSGCYVLCGDNGKFMNHSFDPNCADPDGAYTVTLRRVAAGEELTCDYRSFDVDSASSGLREWEQYGVPELNVGHPSSAQRVGLR